MSRCAWKESLKFFRSGRTRINIAVISAGGEKKMKTMEYILRKDMAEEVRMFNPSGAYVLRINTHDVAVSLTPSGQQRDVAMRTEFIEEIIHDYLSVRDPDQIRVRIVEDMFGRRCDWRIAAPDQRAAEEVQSDLEQRIGITELNRRFRSSSDPTSSLYSIGYIYRERDWEY